MCSFLRSVLSIDLLYSSIDVVLSSFSPSCINSSSSFSSNSLTLFNPRYCSPTMLFCFLTQYLMVNIQIFSLYQLFLTVPFLVKNLHLLKIHFYYPPDNETSWRRRNGVFMYIATTFEAVSNEKPKNVLVERRQDVLVVLLHSVLMERRYDVSRGRLNNVPSDVSTTFQLSLKWNNQRRLNGTYPRRSIGTSLRCLL